MFHENAAEFGIDYPGPPTVRRERVDLDDGRHLSALVWGEEPPELVFFHGGAQNAHTWDTVALALGRPLVCFDLPGHGHSGAGAAGSNNVFRNAEDLAVGIRKLAPDAECVIGMSLGGMTLLALSMHAPELVRRGVLVDITPGVNEEKAAAITAFVNGPKDFPSFEDLLARTIEFNPTRTESSLRRGILHNAEQLEDGSWVWRYARFREQDAVERPPIDYATLWGAVDDFDAPLMHVRGMRQQSVVDDADEAELMRRCPHVRIEHVEDAGHSLQGDTPVEFAALVEDFVFGDDN